MLLLQRSDHSKWNVIYMKENKIQVVLFNAIDLIESVVERNNINKYEDFRCDKMKKLAISLDYFPEDKNGVII